jgi:hypothetical protein
MPLLLSDKRKEQEEYYDRICRAELCAHYGCASMSHFAEYILREKFKNSMLEGYYPVRSIDWNLIKEICENPEISFELKTEQELKSKKADEIAESVVKMLSPETRRIIDDRAREIITEYQAQKEDYPEEDCCLWHQALKISSRNNK